MVAETSSPRNSVKFDPETDGITKLPARLALATLSTGWRWWGILFVFVPVGILAGSLWINPAFANGIVGLCGFLVLTLWAVSYYNYNRVGVQINVAARTLTVIFGNADRLERTVDLTDVGSVSVHVIGSMALIRIEAHTFSQMDRVLLSDPFLVSVNRLQTALNAFSAAGVTVPERSVEDENGKPSLQTMLRLTATALTLVGVPLYALFVFGRSILVTNGTAIVVILGFVALVRELR